MMSKNCPVRILKSVEAKGLLNKGGELFTLRHVLYGGIFIFIFLPEILDSFIFLMYT
jgi:hypothetical protein